MIAVEHRPSILSRWSAPAARTVAFLLPFALYAVLLRMVLPLSLLSAAYYSLTAIAVPAGILLYLAYRWPGALGTMTSLTLTLCLFALPLLALWSHVGVHANAVGGLLPFSDASGYYYDSRRLLDGHLLDWTARRPLFAGMLATLLGLTGQNLQATIAILVAVNAVACFLLAREVRETEGNLAAVIAVMLLFLFYRVEGGLGTTLTENLGLPLGTIGTAVMWRGASRRRLAVTCLGVGLLTLGLMARAGAFFVLPALIVAGVWCFRGAAGRSWRFATAAALAVGLAFGVNLAVGKALADPATSKTAFSNFSNTLYGLTAGGKGWGQALIDHPSAREGSEIYALAWHAFRENPMNAVRGSLEMWRQYLPPNLYHAFAFVRGDTHAQTLQVTCYGLAAIGIFLCVRRRREPRYVLLAAAAVGHVASIPFVPPIDAGLRVYAATMPILAVLVGIGGAAPFHHALRLIGARNPSASPRPAANPAPGSGLGPGGALTFGLLLAGFATVGPLLIHLVSRAPRFVETSCPVGEETVYVRLSRGSLLRIAQGPPSLQRERKLLPEIDVASLRHTAGIVEIKHDVDRYTPGMMMMNGYDLKSGRCIWLVAPTSLVDGSFGVMRVCGHASADALSRNYGVFFADSLERVALR